MGKIKTSEDFRKDAVIFFRNYNKKYIFIRVPKNASSSICKNVGNIKHYSIDFLEEKIKININNYYTFCIVRNPFDRLVSWFSYHKFNVGKKSDKKLNRYYKNSTFKEWIKNGCVLPNSWTMEKDKYNPNPLHQHLWVCDKDNNINVDFVGRYETLKEDYETIKSNIEIKNPLPKINISNHKDYKKYYDSETIDIVNENFKTDLTLFNYKFDEI